MGDKLLPFLMELNLTCIFIVTLICLKLTLTLFCLTLFLLTNLIDKTNLLFQFILFIYLIHKHFYFWYNLLSKKQTRINSSSSSMSVDAHNKRLSLFVKRYDRTATDARLSFGGMINSEILNIKDFSLKFFSFEIDALDGGRSCKVLTWITYNFKSSFFLNLD